MSGTVVGWAWDQRVDNARRKLVLVKLADQANDDGVCWPSLRTLARQLEMSKSAVQRELEGLALSGLLRIEQRRRENGAKTSNLYHLQTADPVPSGRDRGVPSGRDTLSHLGGTEGESPIEKLSTEVESAARPRDLVFDAVAVAMGQDPLEVRLTKSERGRWNSAVRDLKQIGATPEQITAAAAAYRQHQTFKECALTPTALAANWTLLATAAKPAEARAADDLRRRMNERGIA